MRDLERLRTLIEARRLERGGGEVPESQTDAAKEIGMAQASLYHLLYLNSESITVETCIRLARYLELPRATILIMAGHDDIAAMISAPEPDQPDISLAEISRAIDPLDDTQRRAVVNTVKTLSKTLLITPRKKAKKA